MPDGGGRTDEALTRRIDLPPYSLWETRAGAGTPVVLIHGLSGSSRWWSKNVEALAERHLVAAVDLVGFGHWRPRALPELPLPFGETTTLLARWLETFGEPVHLVGHSMGGEIAIRLAAERPELVRSLVLVNAAGMPFRIKPGPHLKALPKPPFGGPRIAKVLLPDFLRAGPTSVVVASARVLRGDARPWMRALRMPTLLVWGANDPLVPLPYGEAMQQEIEGARLEVIDRAAHVSMWDAPEEFNRIVLQFLDEVEAGGPTRYPLPATRFFAWGLTGFTNDMAHREAGRERNVILIHGLGMSSAYFEPFARALFERGLSPIAMDLPGFGESANARASTPSEHAQILAAWADALGIREATWIGHSSGCNSVAHLAAARPDLVRRAVAIGPLWSESPYVLWRLVGNLLLDGFREPLALYRFILRAYWRVGLARWFGTFRRYLPDCRRAAPPNVECFAGDCDPIPDRRTIRALKTVPGAHACQFSHPADAVTAIFD